MESLDDYDHISTYLFQEVVPDPSEINSQSSFRDQNILKHRMWRFTPLYRTGATGALLIWFVGFNIDTNQLITRHGQVGGKLRNSEALIELNKSKRNIHQQALLKARSDYTKKFRNECYRPAGEKLADFSKVSLAHKWEVGKTRLNYPVLVQPKMDGNRCHAHYRGDTFTLLSRANVEWPHIRDELQEELTTFMTYIPVQCDLDGEIYIHGMKTTQLSRIIKNVEVKDPRIKDLNYYIYDFNCLEPIPMESRYQILMDAKEAYHRDGHARTRFDVLSGYLANSKEDIFKYHKIFVAHNFEGTIIRKLLNGSDKDKDIKASLYKPGRSMNLLKYKDVDDDEGLVVNVIDCEGAERGAALLVVECKHPDSSGKEVTTNITMRPAFPIEERREWLKDPSLVLGQLVTYQYQEITEYGVPRNPVLKSFRSKDDL